VGGAVLFAKDITVMAWKVPMLKYDGLASLCHFDYSNLEIF
jgi:hypothetical protein